METTRIGELQKANEKDGKLLAGQEGKYLTFSLGKEEYGIGILKVREINGMMPITNENTIPVATSPLRRLA